MSQFVKRCRAERLIFGLIEANCYRDLKLSLATLNFSIHKVNIDIFHLYKTEETTKARKVPLL